MGDRDGEVNRGGSWIGGGDKGEGKFDEDGLGDACDDISLTEEFVMGVNIYPNPAKSIVNVSCTLNNIDNVYFKLFNSVGQLVLHDQFTNVKEFDFEIDVEFIERGLYSIELRNTNSSSSHLILIN